MNKTESAVMLVRQ